jgi:hypothetical protein
MTKTSTDKLITAVDHSRLATVRVCVANGGTRSDFFSGGRR